MTRAERLVCALSLEEPDQIPIYDLVDHRGIISRFAGEELTLENAGEVIPRALSRVLDTTRVWLPVRPGKRVDQRGFAHQRDEWFNEWVVDKPFHDMQSLKIFVSAEIERLRAWQPGEPGQALRERREWQVRFGETVLPAVEASEAFTDCAILVGFDQYIYLEDEDPALVSRWVAEHHAATMRRLQSEVACREISPIGWIFADVAYKEHLMFSKRYLIEHGFFRRLAEIMDFYRAIGLKVIFHSDGDITPIVPDLIQAGAHAIAPVDTVAGMDLAYLKREFGRQVGFVGGIDFVTLAFHTADEVRSITRRAIQTLGPGGGFVLGSSSEELYESLPEDNILAMWETARECGRYPIH
jgi:uroporphyrinogen decarboxylase